MEQTLGQKRVKAEFNPAKNGMVDQFKNSAARLIDLVEQKKGCYKEFEGYNELRDEAVKFLDLLNSIDNLEVSRELERAKFISYRSIIEGINLFFGETKGFSQPAVSGDGDHFAYPALEEAQTHIETACMYAVKACFTN
jgi:hypothetical protein